MLKVLFRFCSLPSFSVCLNAYVFPRFAASFFYETFRDDVLSFFLLDSCLFSGSCFIPRRSARPRWKTEVERCTTLVLRCFASRQGQRTLVPSTLCTLSSDLPWGQGAWALAPSPFGEKLAPCRNNLCQLILSGPVLEKDMRLPQSEEHPWRTVCCFVGLLVVVALFLLRINLGLFGWFSSLRWVSTRSLFWDVQWMEKPPLYSCGDVSITIHGDQRSELCSRTYPQERDGGNGLRRTRLRIRPSVRKWLIRIVSFRNYVQERASEIPCKRLF